MSIVLTKLEEDLNFLANGRQPQFFGKWKTTSIFWKMEDDLNFLENGRQPQFFDFGNDLKYLKIEDDLVFGKW